MFLGVKCPLFLYQNKFSMNEELKLAIARDKLKEAQKYLVGNIHEQFFIAHLNKIQNEIESQLHQSFEGEST
jgi:hypothetical protein